MRGRDRAGEKKRRWYRSSNEHTTQNTRVLPREMVRGDAIRHDVFLALSSSQPTLHTMCSLYPTGFVAQPTNNDLVTTMQRQLLSLTDLPRMGIANILRIPIQNCRSYVEIINFFPYKKHKVKAHLSIIKLYMH